MRFSLAVALMALTLGCEKHPEFEAGLAGYRQGRFAAALARFEELESKQGHEASAELIFNRGLAALRNGQQNVAEMCAEKAAARGGEAFYGLRDFLLGNTAFRRCRVATAEAMQPNADPIAIDLAIRAAEAARSNWQSARNTRVRWPEADHNIALAERTIDELRRKKAEKNSKRRKEQLKKEQPEEKKPGEKEPEKKTDEPPPPPDLRKLTALQLKELLSMLDRKEKEKRALRLEQQRKRHVPGRKDW